MKTKIQYLLMVLTLLASLTRAVAKFTDDANQTKASYQGQLSDSSTPTGLAASGSYDFTLTLFNTITNGSPVAGPITNTAVGVNSNGLFLASMDFGSSPFNGATNWLEIAVRTNGGSGFITLSPRQLLTSVPQSVYALSAGVANGVSASAVIQGQSLSVGQSNTLAGAYSTVAGGGYNTATFDYAVVAGGYGNTASSNSAAVGGGSGNVASGDHAVVAGGEGNIASGTHAFVGGGLDNSALSDEDVVVGGVSNSAAGDPSFIGAGINNHVGVNIFQFNAWNSFIVCGQNNTNLANWSGIGGGFGNTIQTGSTYSFIGGGDANTIQINATEATIAGGTANTAASPNSAIAGGYQNLIQNNTSYAFIGAGKTNTIYSGAGYSVIGGGYDNGAGGGFSVVGGGYQNGTSAFYSGVGGGIYNKAGGVYSMVGGGWGNNASGTGSFIGGGGSDGTTFIANNNQGPAAAIVGGVGNLIQNGANEAFIGGGGNNTASGAYATLAGGEGNTASGTAAVVGGGAYNLVSGVLGFIGGGSFNSALANHSGIGSGETNTIQTNAYFSYIGGGDNNLIQSNATESVIGGGTANTIQNFASDSTIGGGFGNLIGGGFGFNTNTGVVINNTAYDTIGGGLLNTASNYNATVSGGGNNTADNAFTTIPGGQQAVATNYAQLAYSGGQFQNPGDSQYSLYVLRSQTGITNTASSNNVVHTANLYLDGSSLEIGLPANRSVAYNIRVVARSQGGSGPTTTVFLIRGGASGSTQSVGTPIVDLPLPLNELGLATGDVTLSVTAPGFLRVTVSDTGAPAGTIINWTATVQTTEESF